MRRVIAIIGYARLHPSFLCNRLLDTLSFTYFILIVILFWLTHFALTKHWRLAFSLCFSSRSCVLSEITSYYSAGKHSGNGLNCILEEVVRSVRISDHWEYIYNFMYISSNYRLNYQTFVCIAKRRFILPTSTKCFYVKTSSARSVTASKFDKCLHLLSIFLVRKLIRDH
jgi:hypothetical protein